MGNSSTKTSFTATLQRLSTEDVDAGDQMFWDLLWKTPLSVEEIFELMTPDAVRSLISQRPGNLQTLVTQAVAQLYQVVETPYPIYFDQALNCARILARLLPFLLESTTGTGAAAAASSCSSPALRRLLWQKQRVPREEQEQSESEGKRGRLRSNSDDHHIVGSGGGSGLTSSSSSAASDGKRRQLEDDEQEHEQKGQEEEEEEEDQETEPLAVILVNSIFHLLFLPDFTIEDPNIDFNEQDLGSQTFKSALLWAPGVGCSEKSLAVGSQYDRNRIEILRLLLAACSDSLYQNPDSFDSCESLWLEVGTSPEVPYAEIVFCSLMNVVLGYDPIGYGVPYGKLAGDDTAFALMEVAIQALVVLLDFGHPICPLGSSSSSLCGGGGGEEGDSSGSSGTVTYVAAEDEHAHGFNIFRKMLRDIDDPAQLNFIFRGFSRLLNNVHQSQTTFLPHSATQVSIAQELMVLLWKCLEEMPAFLPFLLRENSQCDVNELVVPVCFFLLEGRKDPSKLGMLYLCTFVLLKLSGERSFSVGLNKPYKTQLPVDMPIFKGSHADLVVVVLHKLMVGGMDKLSSLYTCFLTIICNISPYCKALCASAAHKIVNLLELFTSPKVLFASDSNYTSVVMLLESLNNLVQYQYEGNFNLVFSILTRRRVFEWLNNFAVPTEQTAASASSVAASSDNSSATEQQQSQQLQQQGVGEGGQHVNVSVTVTEEGEDQDEEVAEGGRGGGDEEEDDSRDSPATSSVPTPVISLREEEEERACGSGSGGGMSSSLDEKAGSTESAKEEVKDEDKEGVTEGSVVGAPPPPPPAPSNPQGQQQGQQQQGQGFTPTPEWVARVKRELPLHTLMRLLRYLVPLVEELAAKAGRRMDELGVLGFLRRTTMVGILPVPHPIVIRKYQPNKFTSLWFTAFMWGVVFLHNQGAPKLFDGRGVRLFMVQGGAAAKQQQHQRQEEEK